MASKLQEKRDALKAKQDKLHAVFAASGEDLDFAKPDVLKETGATDAKHAVEIVREWNKEMEDLGKEVDDLATIEKARKALNDSRNEPVDPPPLPDGQVKKERKTLGQMVVESEAFQKFKQSGTPSKSIVELGLAELKTVFSTTAGWPPESTRIPGLVIPEAVRPIQVTDIIPPGTTGQAAVVYMEETTATFAAAERAEAAAYAEAEFVLTEQSSTVRSIGASIPVTDEQLQDVEGVQSYLDQRLGFGVRQRLDGQLLVGNGTPPNLRGINNVVGIQTQAKGADSVPDAVYKAMDLVRVTGRAFPNAVVFHPNDWQEVRLLKTADGVYIWGSPSEAGPQRIWGLTAVLSDAQTENTALVGDYMNFSQLYERRGLEVLVGFVNDDFLDGRRTIRAGLRAAFVVYRPAAFATVTGL